MQGEWFFDKVEGDLVYMWDQEDNIFRMFKESRTPELIIPAPLKFGQDDAYVILDDEVYVSNCRGELKLLIHDSTEYSTVLIDKKGSYDDDIDQWLKTDGNALYWIAGPEDGIHIHDETWGTLFKTLIIK